MAVVGVTGVGTSQATAQDLPVTSGTVATVGNTPYSSATAGCDSSVNRNGWHVIMNGVTYPSGAAITAADFGPVVLTFTNGSSGQALFTDLSGNSTAHFLDAVNNQTGGPYIISSARMTFPTGTDITGYNNFVISHAPCGVNGTTTTTSTSTTSTSTTTTSTTVPPSSTTTSTTSTSTSTTSTSTSTTSTTLPELPKIDGICTEVDVDGEDVKYWYNVTVDGTTTRVFSTTSGVVVIDEEPYEVAVPEDICETDVKITKNVEGQPIGTEYKLRISRLVTGLGEVPGYEQALPDFVIAEGETTTIALPSSFDPSGISYRIQEVVNGGATQVAIVPSDTFSLNTSLTQTVSLVITNYFASVEIIKTVDSTSVFPGDIVTYEIVAENTGGLALKDVEISDRLPAGVSTISPFSSALVVDGNAATCAQATPTADISCVFTGLVLQPGAKTPKITLKVRVDAIVPGGQIVNQSKVVGFYVVNAVQPTLADRRLDAVVDELSCTPLPEGAVCDVSPRDGATSTGGTPSTTTTPTTVAPTTVAPTTQPPATIVQVGGPVTTTTVAAIPPKLPVTGRNSSPLVALGALMVVLGLAMAAMGRRRDEQLI